MRASGGLLGTFTVSELVCKLQNKIFFLFFYFFAQAGVSSGAVSCGAWSWGR